MCMWDLKAGRQLESQRYFASAAIGSDSLLLGPDPNRRAVLFTIAGAGFGTDPPVVHLCWRPAGGESFCQLSEYNPSVELLIERFGDAITRAVYIRTDAGDEPGVLALVSRWNLPLEQL